MKHRITFEFDLGTVPEIFRKIGWLEGTARGNGYRAYGPKGQTRYWDQAKFWDALGNALIKALEERQAEESVIKEVK